MSNENKKSWFRRYKNQVNTIKRLEERREILEERITSIRSPNYSGMPRGGTPVTIADLLSDKAEVEERIRRGKDKARSIRREILEVIDSIDEVNHAEVIEYRYIDCLDPDEISEIIGYSPRHIHRILTQAIEAVDIPGLNDPEEVVRSGDLNQVE